MVVVAAEDELADEASPLTLALVDEAVLALALALALIDEAALALVDALDDELALLALVCDELEQLHPATTSTAARADIAKRTMIR